MLVGMIPTKLAWLLWRGELEVGRSHLCPNVLLPKLGCGNTVCYLLCWFTYL